MFNPFDCYIRTKAFSDVKLQVGIDFVPDRQWKQCTMFVFGHQQEDISSSVRNCHENDANIAYILFYVPTI